MSDAPVPATPPLVAPPPVAPPPVAPPLVATSSQTVGPFFGFALTADASLGRMVAPSVDADRIALRVRVVDADRQPVTDAIVELWHAVADAHAPAPAPAADAIPTATASIFGRLPTGEDGACEFETVRPVRTADGQGGQQAAHVNVCLFARGLLRHLFTRLYFANDPALAEDAVLALVPEHRRSTLLAQPDGDGRWLFELVLQGERETVFFDA